MIPSVHVVILGLLQFAVGLVGLLLRRPGMVVMVSAVVMLNGVLLVLCATAAESSLSQVEGVVVLALIVAVALTGSAILYAFHRFRKTVLVDEHDRMKH
jgi:NADH:ubiquinone oxidoreductase subunit K